MNVRTSVGNSDLANLTSRYDILKISQILKRHVHNGMAFVIVVVLRSSPAGVNIMKFPKYIILDLVVRSNLFL